jgi:hypothetical protein
LGGTITGLKGAAAATGSRLWGVLAAVVFNHLQAFGLRKEIRLATKGANLANR